MTAALLTAIANRMPLSGSVLAPAPLALGVSAEPRALTARPGKANPAAAPRAKESECGRIHECGGEHRFGSRAYRGDRRWQDDQVQLAGGGPLRE